MLELRLRSGTVVAFDGRIVEVFARGEPSRRFHVAQLGSPEAVEAADGGSMLMLPDAAVTVSFAREEAPACARLVAVLASARAASERDGSG